jgi:beta-phosphoglucomutase-like phosphatase (HAD superfamily)
VSLQAVIFDVDGTLAETDETHRKAFNRAFADAGLHWLWGRERYRELLAVSGGKERIRQFVAEEDQAQADRADFDDLVAGLHRIKTAHFAT